MCRAILRADKAPPNVLTSSPDFQMNLDKNPYEAGLDPFIKPNKKTAFVGQDAVREMKGREQKVNLVMLNFQTQNVDPYGNETIWYGNKVINKPLAPDPPLLHNSCWVWDCGIGLGNQKPKIQSQPHFDSPTTCCILNNQPLFRW